MDEKRKEEESRELTPEEIDDMIFEEQIASGEYDGEAPEYYFSNPDPYVKAEPRPDDAPKREFTFDEKGNIVVKNLSAFWLPDVKIVESIGGATLIGMAVGLSFYDAVLVGSGLGWYSFSSVVISAMYSTEIGTVSFLANMLRELSAFFLIPVLVRLHKLLALAPSGAATMDSGLPVVIKYTNLHVGMYSFINGLVLTLIVPVLLSWLLSLK